jgi:hypothetical protein
MHGDENELGWSYDEAVAARDAVQDARQAALDELDELAEYLAGRRYGACDARAGVFQPQAFASEPRDFRQGYVDGWEATSDAMAARA